MESDRDPEEIELNKETQADKSEESNTKFERVKKIVEEGGRDAQDKVKN